MPTPLFRLLGLDASHRRKRDPRADALREHEAAREVMATVDAVTPGAGTFPNVDLAPAALVHAIEEYREPGLRFRPVDVCTGPLPQR
ncbi:MULTISPECIES: hypothetical protein [Saccharothrix]|uniref:hypothetical protein n=1 Tax=Saccharothrix TaxID=2071 RepID=UPI00093B2AD8|nr:hypothetical protein [Saccharothrix sp. CB00851]OKI31985.1 hypothetical protein A6A25_26440 [Saccharothrix sp. CB00851]